MRSRRLLLNMKRMCFTWDTGLIQHGAITVRRLVAMSRLEPPPGRTEEPALATSHVPPLLVKARSKGMQILLETFQFCVMFIHFNIF